MLFSSIFSLLSLLPLAFAVPRTSPPTGAITVGKSGTFKTVSAAVASLGNGKAPQTIFIYSGSYNEQVFIKYGGPLTIYGQTSDTTQYAKNTVTITFSTNAAIAGSDDLSGTLRAHLNNFSLYNVNVINSYGTHPQAIALSAAGSKHGYYGCQIIGHQDTVLTEAGTQYFGKSYIEGATDYIFGQDGVTYLKGCTIASNGVGYITAGAPRSATTPGIYVFNKCNIVQAASATSSLVGLVSLGRPWSQYARVIFISSSLSDIIAPAGWSQWGKGKPIPSTVTYAEYRNNGAGAAIGQRAGVSKQLSSADVKQYSIGNVLGSDYASWIDPAYL